MPTIRLKVENKQVFALEEYCIVNYNKDYEVEFTFDAEWDNYNVKTARFVFGGRVEDVVFEGNVCKMPMITKGSNVGIGVFSGDLESTTKAHIPCLKSILEENGIPEDPSNNVYNQIVELLNKYLEQGGGGSSSGITESEVRKIVEEVVAGEIEKLPVTIDASVDELTYAITIELKDKAGNVVSTKTLSLPIKDVDLTDYVKFEDRNTFVKDGVTENDITLTDTEQTNACKWLGALKQAGKGGRKNIQAYGVLQDGSLYMINICNNETDLNASGNSYLSTNFFKNVIKPTLENLQAQIDSLK